MEMSHDGGVANGKKSTAFALLRPYFVIRCVASGPSVVSAVGAAGSGAAAGRGRSAERGGFAEPAAGEGAVVARPPSTARLLAGERGVVVLLVGV